MKFEIKSWWTGGLLFELECGSLKICLEAGVKNGAYLTGAYLKGAYLTGARGCAPELTTPLLMLLDQAPGTKLRSYKLVNAEDEGPFNGGLKYKIGKPVSVENANTDPEVDCGRRINVATLDWCLLRWQKGWRILVIEHAVEDIAAIPYGTDGKYRLHRGTPISEKSIDYGRIFPKAPPKAKKEPAAAEAKS